MSESHSETRVLEYPLSTPFRHTKVYLRVLRAEETGLGCVIELRLLVHERL